MQMNFVRSMLVVLVAGSVVAAELQYIVQVTGDDGFPAPPSNYAIATLDDVHSKSFEEAYNTDGGLMMSATSGINSCCILQVAEGWLKYDSDDEKSVNVSPVSLYTVPGNQLECFPDMTAQQVLLGTGYGASASVFQKLSDKTATQLSTFTFKTTQQWCNGMNSSLTLLKRLG
jgi:hypothetical protein